MKYLREQDLVKGGRVRKWLHSDALRRVGDDFNVSDVLVQ